MEQETKQALNQTANPIVWQDRKHHLWFPISFTKYTVKNNRMLIQKGFLNSQLDETLLYRIVDLTMNQSLLGKLFGTGNITITSRVDTNTVQVLENIKNPAGIYELLSEAVEDCRRSQNVVGKEFYGGRGSVCHDPETHIGGEGMAFDMDGPMHDESL